MTCVNAKEGIEKKPKQVSTQGSKAQKYIKKLLGQFESNGKKI